MRALRVVSLGIDGRTVILETVPHRSGEKRERFTLPIDDGLHAAVRGDLPRLGQIEIELENQMRPREIQARIRAGASVDQVAQAAGLPAQRIERFAHPVLLERSRTTELAQRAHPVRIDGPDVRTLHEVVADTFARRGHDHSAASWDSWRGENGKWVVQLRWRAGRSDNRAHWTFHPGAHGGTVTAIDDHAVDLIDPDAGKPLRTVPSVADLAEPAPTKPATPPEQPAETVLEEPVDEPVGEPGEQPVEQQRPAALAVPDDGVAYRRRGPEQQDARVETPDETPKRGRKNHPIVPSWEDVLLGVRSPRT